MSKLKSSSKLISEIFSFEDSSLSSLENLENNSTRSVGKNGFLSVAVNSSVCSAFLECMYNDLWKSILLFIPCKDSSLNKASSKTKRSYTPISISSILFTTSSWSEVFWALSVTSLLTTGLSFTSNIFTLIPLIVLCNHAHTSYLHYCIEKKLK